jgi:hypothetical protein
MRLSPVFALVLLAGCATPKTPGIEVRTVETVVTRVEKCIAEADIPSRPRALPKRPSKDARVLADLLLAKVRSWELYGDKVDPVLKGCASSGSQ